MNIGPVSEKGRKQGFTLVEVSLALALAAFALVTVLGALPAGLRAVREAQSQEIATNVAQRLQASLQQLSFASGTSGITVDTLADKPAYYTQDGLETADPTAPGQGRPPPFYKAVFAVGSALFNDGSSTGAGTAIAQAGNARTVTLTLWYPQSGTVAGKRKYVFSFLITKQRLD